MQIRASQRQVKAQATRPHTVLARRWALQRRFVTGGALALTVSVPGWLFGASLPLHLGLVTLGFALGFFWRFTQVGRRAERWAFSWIEARAGLSYLTAHELSADTQNDAEANSESGSSRFAEAVRARAAQVGRLETPALQPWALPLVVLALTFALLPHLVLPALRAPFAPPTGTLPGAATPSVFQTTPPDTTPPEPDPDVATPPPPEQAPNPADGTASEAETAAPAENASADDPSNTPNNTPGNDPGTGNGGVGRSFDDAGTAPEGSAAEGEQAALERFLEQNSAAQPPPQASSPQTGGNDSRPEGDAAPKNKPGDSSGSPKEAQAGQDTPNAAPNEGAKAGAEPGAGSAAGRKPASQQNSGQEGGSGEAPQAEAPKSEAPGDKGEAGQAGSEQNAPQAKPGTEPQRAQSGSEQTGRQDDPSSSAGSSAGERSAAPNDGGKVPEDPQGPSSDQAGRDAGSDLESSRERLGGASKSAPDQLNGAREDGPVSFSGKALRQGDAPDTLPQTGSAQGYRQAAEEVIREGRIPLAYQEVIRDYFR